METERISLAGCSDEVCWSYMKDGCKDSLEVLYLRFYNNLFDYAVSFCGDADTAEDQIHALFLKIWERRELLPEVEYVKTYLWTSLRRSLIDEKRRQFRLDTTTNLLKIYDFTMVSSPEEIRLYEEHNQEVLLQLYKAVQQLQPRQREVVYLKFFEGMSYREIEAITSLSYQSVRNYTSEAVKTLRYALKKSATRESGPVHLALINTFSIWLSFCSIFSLFSL